MIPKSANLTYGKSLLGYGEFNGIILDKIFSVVKNRKGRIEFTEEMDGYNCVEMSKKDAIEMLQEIIEYINKDITP